MSIALNARLRELEHRLKALESAVDILRANAVVDHTLNATDVVDQKAPDLTDNAAVIPAKRKPGRPPKNA